MFLKKNYVHETKDSFQLANKGLHIVCQLKLSTVLKFSDFGALLKVT